MTEKKKRDFEPLPYYRWYWRAFRGSRAVQKMHYVARGLYRELLDECWASGCIPDDPDRCGEIIDVPAKIMAKHWPALRPMFTSIGDALLINERIENERTESDRLRVVRAVNGRRGAEVRWQTMANDGKPKQTMANDGNLLSSSSSSSSSSEQSKSSSGSQDLPAIAALAPQGARGDAGWDSIKNILRASGATPPIGFRVPPDEQ